jgi:3alpha(or 20beta)-hydroxysteroid dehydrogenase
MGALQGKVAIITGASRGQGAAEARLFYAEGAAVVLTDVVSHGGHELAEELGERAVFIRHDVSDKTGWAQVADSAKSHFGGIDILVNNAGVTGYQSVETIEAAEMQRYLDIHLYGAIFGIQAVLPLMAPRGGAIINVASTAALRGNASYVGYGVSKWAVRGLTRYAAHDLVKHNIRINTILPGGVDTPMLNRPDATALVAAARAAVPMKRFGTAEELAKVALFLASDASSYLTGSEIVVDGGLNA